MPLPSTRFGPVCADVVVVGQPVHDAPRFIVFHGIGQRISAARSRQCFASSRVRCISIRIRRRRSCGFEVLSRFPRALAAAFERLSVVIAAR
jgi:hypothetical protein